MQRPQMKTEESSSKLVVSFRGTKHELSLVPGITAGDVKTEIASACSAASQHLQAKDVKLMHKGKVIADDNEDIHELLVKNGKPKSTYRLMATGMSWDEIEATRSDFERGLGNAPRIRDDLTRQGRQELSQRRRLGQQMLQKAASRQSGVYSQSYGFGKIEALPMLPDQEKAKAILHSLAHDPGIRACMAKHKWNVGCLSEMFPEGKVGESAVCVMGLNRNKGQEILLRLRTDDLKGFRKILSIRKVLFHELAHNVHSEHDQKFFQLMRQIERDCNEMSWKKGAGNTTGGSFAMDKDYAPVGAFTGGTYRLAGNNTMTNPENIPVRELAARAAMQRMTVEEQEIEEHCGCGLALTLRSPHEGAGANDTAASASDTPDAENWS